VPTGTYGTVPWDAAGNVFGGLDIQGNYAYVVDETLKAIVVFDISQPSTPVQVGAATFSNCTPQGLDVSGRYAYVDCIGQGRPGIVDITDPTAPSVTSDPWSGENDGPIDLQLQGQFLYGVDQFANFYYADVSTPYTNPPTGPTLTANTPLFSTAWPASPCRAATLTSSAIISTAIPWAACRSSPSASR